MSESNATKVSNHEGVRRQGAPDRPLLADWVKAVLAFLHRHNLPLAAALALDALASELSTEGDSLVQSARNRFRLWTTCLGLRDRVVCRRKRVNQSMTSQLSKTQV